MTHENTDNLIERHRTALANYNKADLEVKQLLKGRQYKDLTEADRKRYQAVSERRDNAYNEMRRLERALLDDIPGSQTGFYMPIDPELLKNAKSNTSTQKDD